MDKLIILTGPTAVGKSKLSIELAKKINGEIISADSMQVYRKMNIGTDKITTKAMDGVPHHMIDILDPEDEFNVYIFKDMVNKIIPEIYSRGHVPIIVGGTGFYIQAVLYDIDFTQTSDNEGIRQTLEKRAVEEGPEALHKELEQVDPESAKAIHANNVKRVIRALEYYQLTGNRISEHNEDQREKTSKYDFRYFVLTDDRSLLYSRIEKRIDEMVENGLVEEVRQLYESGIPADATSMQGIGYRELLGYFRGEYDLERAIYLIKLNTRHFAKRQLTWFRRERDVIWIDKQAFNRDDSLVLQEILNKI